MKPILLFALLFLTACSTVPEATDWPPELPPLQELRAIYQADAENKALQSEEEYLSWIRSFYQGNRLSPGWLTMTEEVLDGQPPEQAADYGRQLASLGRQISVEWARDNEVRRLNTRCILVWREALVEALYRDELGSFLASLQADVDALLQGRLNTEDIVLARYYDMDFELF